MRTRNIKIGDILVMDDRYIAIATRIYANDSVDISLKFDIVECSFTQDEIDFNAKRRLATEAEKVLYFGYIGMINMISIKETI